MPSPRFTCRCIFSFITIGVFIVNLASLFHLQQPEGILKEPHIWSQQLQQLSRRNHEQEGGTETAQNKQTSSTTVVPSKNGTKEKNTNVSELSVEVFTGNNNASVHQYVPIYLGEDPSYHVDPRLQNTHQMTTRGIGRLGNLMFAYASLLGIAKTNHMRPAFPEGNLLWEAFELSMPAINSYPMQHWRKFVEASSTAYDYRTEKLNYQLDLELVGFYQCWKYFQEVEEQIRSEFIFKDKLRHMALDFLEESVKRHFPGASSVTLVGVHVRRGDMLDPSNALRGYNVADADYINNAMTFFEAKYEGRLMFVVASDDIEWSQEYVTSDKAPVVFTEGLKDREDLAILAHCDHMIMTVGTFGWWAAWLTGGTVIYYKDNIAQGSSIDEGFEPQDYFYSSWIGL